MRLVRICRNRPGSPCNRGGTSGAISLANSISFGLGAFGEHLQHAFDRLNQIKIEQLKTQFSRFHFGKVHDVTNDCQQGVRTNTNGLGEFALFPGELCVEQEVGHSDDAVHGRADLMTHVSQEQSFGPICRFGVLLGVVQLLLCPLSLSDISNHLDAPTT